MKIKQKWRNSTLDTSSNQERSIRKKKKINLRNSDINLNDEEETQELLAPHIDSGNQKDQEEIRQVLNLEEKKKKKKNSQLTLRIYSQRPLKKKSKHQNKTSLVTLKLLYFFGYLWLITSEVPPQLIRLGTRTIEWQLLLNSEPKETQIRLHVEAQSQTHTGRLTDIVITESSGLSQVSELLWIEGHSRDFTDEEPSLN